MNLKAAYLFVLLNFYGLIMVDVTVNYLQGHTGQMYQSLTVAGVVAAINVFVIGGVSLYYNFEVPRVKA